MTKDIDILKVWQKRFKESGCRLTKTRMLILDIFRKTKSHLSAEDVYVNAYKIYAGIGLTTVYRTLELLVKLGLVSKYDFGDGRSRFELLLNPEMQDHHHHLVCTKCGRVINYTDFIEEETKFLEKAEKGLCNKYKFKIYSHIIQFYGICDKCSKK